MRRQIRLLAILFALVLAAFPARAAAQGAEPGTPAVTAPASGAAPAPAEAGALPRQGAPPRTLRAYWHVFIAFAVAWVLLFGYALSLGRRFAGLEEEVRRLRA